MKTFLDGLTDEEVATIVAGMKEVAAEGLAAARHLQGEIFEVRADASTRSFRLLFSTEGRWTQILLSLSVFEKRTQRATTRNRFGPKTFGRLAATRGRDAEGKEAGDLTRGLSYGNIALTLWLRRCILNGAWPRTSSP